MDKYDISKAIKSDLYDSGGSIILLTDGDETAEPSIKEVFQEAVDSGASVNTIAMGTEASSPEL